MKGSRCSFPPYFTDFKNFYYPSSPATSIGFKVWETLILSVFPVFFSTKFLLKYRVDRINTGFSGLTRCRRDVSSVMILSITRKVEKENSENMCCAVFENRIKY